MNSAIAEPASLARDGSASHNRGKLTADMRIGVTSKNFLAILLSNVAIALVIAVATLRSLSAAGR